MQRLRVKSRHDAVDQPASDQGRAALFQLWRDQPAGPSGEVTGAMRPPAQPVADVAQSWRTMIEADNFFF